MNSIFDTSTLSLSNKVLSKDEFVTELIVKLTDILKVRFPGNISRQRIKVHKDRINFAAPCCGDSAFDDNKKRGNIILEGKYKNMYKCHNCGTCMSLYNFFKEYEQSLSLGALNYINANTNSELTIDTSNCYIQTNIGKTNNTFKIYNEDLIDTLAVDREIFKSILNLEETNIANIANNYLRTRCQLNYEKFLYSKETETIYVLNLTKSGKIFGLQTRSLYHKEYKTYSLSKIYEIFLKQSDVEIPELINSISMVFNILLVNYTLPVTIVEGPMDSFLVPNCIALCGGGKHITFPFNYRFLFDSDTPGKKYTIEKLNEGHSVFMWNKYKQDVGLPDRKKWDINDLVIWSLKNKVKLLKLDNYYTSSKLDIINV